MHDSNTATIGRDHPVARAILADLPDARLVWANEDDGQRLVIDYVYNAGGAVFYDFSTAASEAVEASWSADDPGPWEKHDSDWCVQIAAEEV